MVGIHFQVFKVNHYHLFFCIQSEILLHVNVSVLVINVYLLIYTLCIMMHETECSTVPNVGMDLMRMHFKLIYTHTFNRSQRCMVF